jgi:hypothetical protein
LHRECRYPPCHCSAPKTLWTLHDTLLGTRRRSWRKPLIGVDADSGAVVAVEVTRKDIDDAAMVDTLLGQIGYPITSFTADGAYDQDRVSQAVAEHDPDTAIIVPPRAGAVANVPAETAPTQRDRHLRMIAITSKLRD